MKVPFQTVDVFTDRQFGGNPVAVIPDARGLSDAQMQAIANEFNLSETTFVLPPVKWTPVLGPAVKVCSVPLCFNQRSERNGEITQEV